MKPSSFDYHAPDSVDEAASLLHELGDEAKVLAGGQSLIPMLSLRLAQFEHLVDVGRVAGLQGVEREGETVVVQAATVDAAAEHHPEIGAGVPLLRLVTPYVGHFQIRTRGTVGGSIAHADPCAEYPAVALALDAEIEATSVRGTRRIPADDYFRGFWTTALEADELLTAVRFPVWSGRCGFAIHEFARRHGDFAIAGAVVAVELDNDGRVTRCAISLLGLGPTPLRATAAEGAIAGEGPGADTRELGQLAMADLADVPGDIHGPPAYRTRVGAAMVERALNDAIGAAAHG